MQAMELFRASRISTNFDADVNEIINVFVQAEYPRRFIQSTIDNFKQKQDEEEKLIPDYFFEERKRIFIKLPYCTENEQLSRRFLKKLNQFTDGKFMFIIRWQTRKIKSLFKLKDVNKHQSSVVYRAGCIRRNTYIGETMRNFSVRKAEHENSSHMSQPARHLLSNPTHNFIWDIIHKEQSLFKRRIIEGPLIAREQPELNKQVQCFIANLYPTEIS